MVRDSVYGISITIELVVVGDMNSDELPITRDLSFFKCTVLLFI